jgi:DNA-directed RNA polymerase specialized sigma24 family protein
VFAYDLRQWRNVPTTKAVAARRGHKNIASRILAEMSARDREVLKRFYLQGQPAERIQADLGVTETEFRVIKARARSSFARGVQERIGPGTVTRNRSAKRA